MAITPEKFKLLMTLIRVDQENRKDMGVNPEGQYAVPSFRETRNRASILLLLLRIRIARELKRELEEGRIRREGEGFSGMESGF